MWYVALVAIVGTVVMSRVSRVTESYIWTALIDFIYVCPIFEWVVLLDRMAGNLRVGPAVFTRRPGPLDITPNFWIIFLHPPNVSKLWHHPVNKQPD